MLGAATMKRRTLKSLRASRPPEFRHNVYVVLLTPAAGRLVAVRAANPDRRRGQPCVYVGMTGLTPEERFANHKRGIKAAVVVQRQTELRVHRPEAAPSGLNGRPARRSICRAPP